MYKSQRRSDGGRPIFVKTHMILAERILKDAVLAETATFSTEGFDHISIQGLVKKTLSSR